MDVDRFSFSSLLPAMLEAIDKSDFIAFDLELSGIQSRQFSSTKSTALPHMGKHTLQQRYEELKAAAERFQVLQVGFTCVREDNERGAVKRCVLLDVALLTYLRHLHFTAFQFLS
jgi:poly(A)-specific ribonuclease